MILGLAIALYLSVGAMILVTFLLLRPKFAETLWAIATKAAPELEFCTNGEIAFFWAVILLIWVIGWPAFIEVRWTRTKGDKGDDVER